MPQTVYFPQLELFTMGTTDEHNKTDFFLLLLAPLRTTSSSTEFLLRFVVMLILRNYPKYFNWPLFIVWPELLSFWEKQTLFPITCTSTRRLCNTVNYIIRDTMMAKTKNTIIPHLITLVIYNWGLTIFPESGFSAWIEILYKASWLMVTMLPAAPFPSTCLYVMIASPSLLFRSLSFPPFPRLPSRYVFTIVSYLIGVFIFATIVGQVGNVITNRNANRLEFERLLDGAKTYMRHHKVSYSHSPQPSLTTSCCS